MKETPKNITYHTPRPNSPGSLSNESLEQSYKSIEAAEPVSSGRLLLRREESLTTAKYEGRANSLAVFGTCLAEGSNMDETSKGVQSQANRLINTVDRGSPQVPYEDALGANQCPFELEPTGHSPSRDSVCISEMGWASDSSSDVSRRDKQLDSLSADLLTNLSLQVSTIRRGREVSKKVTRIDESFQETPAENVEYRASQRCHPQTGKDPNSVQGSACSSQSDYSTSRKGTSSVSEHDSQTSVSPGTSKPAPEAAIKKALALRAKGKSIDLIFLDLGCGSNDVCLKFCQNLWKLCFSFEKKNLLEEASIALDLIQEGYTRVFGSTSIKTMHCMVYQARMLKKRKEYKDSESAYRQAINGLRNLKETKSQLICQLFLADFLKSLGKLSEALHHLLETLIEHFNSRVASIETKVPEVMGSMQRLHLKMDVDQNMVKVMASVTQLQELQSAWPEPYHEFNVWVGFVRLGGCYSEIGKFDMAELCFSHIRPAGYEGTNPYLKIELARFHKERSLHDRRQSRLTDSIIQLKVAFKHLLSVEPPDEYDQALAIELEQLLGEFKSQKMQTVGNSSLQTAWEQIRDTFRVFVDRRRIKELKEREMMQCEESRTPSSHGSAMFSSCSSSSRFGVTYSGGSESSIVSNSAFIVSS
jgi:tetratricopeptide (TPR) repeat protein